MAKTGDSGVSTAPSVRTYVFGGAPPVLTSTGDAGVSTTPTTRNGIWQPTGVDTVGTPLTNVPSAPSDLGSA